MTKPLSCSAFIQVGTGIIEAAIDGEIVALDVSKGTCYGLNRVGSRIWELIGSPVRVGDLCIQLAAEFDVDPIVCEQQTVDLLEELRAEGLVVVTEPAENNSPD